MTKQEEFKNYCLNHFSIVGVNASSISINLRGTPMLISNKCQATGILLNESNFDIGIRYWLPNSWYPVHKDFKHDYMKNEAYNCQKLDTNCNDCKHLNRAEMKCLKLNKGLSFAPNTCMPENQDCFIHRKDEL